VSSLILPDETALPQLDYDSSEDEASYEIPAFTLNKACTGLEIKVEITDETNGITVETDTVLNKDLILVKQS
jgi:hypothetical protein